MRFPRLVTAAIFLHLWLVVGHSQTTTPDTDFQVWNDTTLVMPVLKSTDSNGKTFDRVSLLLLTTLRLGQNRLAPVDERIGGGLEIAFTKNLSFSPTYLYVATAPERNKKEFEHRIRFDATFSHRFRHFGLKDRNRIEYRIKNSKPDSVRYRNKFTFSLPIYHNDKELFSPFVSDEPYYDLTAGRWSRNDFSAGIAKKLSEKVSSEFFYVWRHNVGGSLSNVHALGVNLKIRLR